MMLEKRMSIKEFQERFKSGEFDGEDIMTQIKAGWCDWFCSERLLSKKTKTLGNFVLELKNSKRVNLEKHYVSFKNNCSSLGSKYDSVSICDIETEDPLYVVSFNEKWAKEKFGGSVNVYDVASGNFSEPIVSGRQVDALAWLNEQ